MLAIALLLQFAVASEHGAGKMPAIHELQKQRADHIKKAAAIRDGAKASDREPTDDEITKINGAVAAVEELDKQIAEAKTAQERAQRLASIDGLLDSIKADPAKAANDNAAAIRATVPATVRRFNSKIWKGADAEKKAHAFGSWMRYAYNGNGSDRKWLADNGYIDMDAAQYTTGNTAGGFLVPPSQLFNEVIDLVEQYGVFRQNAQMLPMSGDNILVPKIDTGITSYWVTEATADSATAITKSSLAGSNVGVTAGKLATLTLASREMFRDSAVNVGELIGRKIALAFAQAEDNAGFIGDGSATYGGYTGILTHCASGSLYTSGTAGQSSFGALTITEISNFMAKLPAYARTNAKFYISAAGYSALMARLAYAAGGTTKADIAGGFGPTFMGAPVVITQVLNSTLTAQTSTKLFLYGDLSLSSYFGERQGTEIAVSDDRYFDTDQIAIRGIERVGVTSHSCSGSTAGPVVCFKTSSS